MNMVPEEEETSCFSSSNPTTDGEGSLVALLDEYWFFHNLLGRGLLLHRRRSSVGASYPCRAQESVQTCQVPVATEESPPLQPLPAAAPRDELTHSNSKHPNRALLRMPSLPPARVATASEEVVPEPSRLSNPKLRRSCSSFVGNSKYSSPKNLSPNISTRRNRGPQDMKIDDARRQGGSNKLDKWKSLSDLEWFEVQGCKDLGFVFGKEEGTDAGLERMIPGLPDCRPDTEVVTCPYLSEAWLIQRSAPPRVRWRESGASAEDMKEQLKFWAKAVACNVRCS